MATVTMKQQGGQFGGFTPYGNVTTLRYELKTNASGVPQNSSATAALAVNDVVKFQYPLPAGLVVQDVMLVVSDAFDASVTCDLGFAYEDGVDVTERPQDADAWFAGQALSSVARVRTASTAELFALPKPAFLTLTVKGANIASAGALQVVVTGERA